MQYSVVQYSEAVENSDFRIDAEYWHPQYLKVENLIQDNRNQNLQSIANIKGGKRLPLGLSFSDSGVPYIRAEDVKDSFVDFDSSPFISNELHNLLKNYQTKYDDVLLTIVGNSIGDVGIIKFKLDRCNLTENCAKICNTKDVNPDVLFSFLKSKYGQFYIEREKVGSAQPKLSLERIRSFRIPIFNKNFQNKVSSIINHSYSLKTLTKSLYQQAENLLLEELGLKDWKPKHQLFYVKNYSDTQQAERFDAEYFQPQYDAIIEKIKSYNQKQGIKKEVILDDVVKWSKGVEVGSEQYLDEGFDFIRISDFSTKGISETSKKISKELFAELKGKYSPKKGDILFTKDGTIGLTYLVDQNQDSIVSGAFLKLRPKIEIEAEYLTLVLNSVICKKQIEMMSGGAIIAHLKPSDAMNLQIPILKPEKQKEISLKIVDSKEKDKQSKSLLEVAKKAVEMAIESNEEKATNWIDQELEKLGVQFK